MKKNNRFLLMSLLLLPAGCIYPGQMFLASGVTGNACCDSQTLVVITKEADGQKVNVYVSPSASGGPSASSSVTPSTSVSPSVSPSPSGSATPSASASPSSSVSTSASPTVSPSVTPSSSATPTPSASK